MTTNDWLIIAIFLLGIIALIGIFRTKTAGFGRYSMSLLLLAAGKIESSLFANIAFAVAGFAGGLITRKHESAPNPAVHTNAVQ
ncbi:MAG: hypothetical protein M0Z99_06200 [Betaproteobacteria bacterium]|nr:hypothetical protein [Betaproteobacteria bacterium]